MLTNTAVERLRAETPGCAEVIHLNNAGAALPPQPVVDTVVAHLRREATIGGYEAADEAAGALADVYGSVAHLIGAAEHQIAIVENATRAWDMAFYALARDLGPGDRILTSRAEYASNVIAFLQVARRSGAQVEVVPDDEHGQVSVAALEELIDDRVACVAVSHVPTQGGLVNPAEEIGAVTRAAGVPFLLDACQSVGQLPIDVERIGCDVLSATSRKYLRGPRGVGFLYVADDLLERLEPPFLDLHAATWVADDRYEVRDDARRFENWETNVAAKLGLGAAVDYALAVGMDAISRRVGVLAERLREQLAAIPGVHVHDTGARRCGLVGFTVGDRSPDEVARSLRQRRINVSVTGVASARFDLAPRDIDRLVRASVHYYNTEDDLDALTSALA